MNKDICVRCDEGVVNIRVGVIIIKDNKVLNTKRYHSLCEGKRSYRYPGSGRRGVYPFINWDLWGKEE